MKSILNSYTDCSIGDLFVSIICEKFLNYQMNYASYGMD